ncbi:MAG: hypothetical protein O3C45_10235 [Bacteroidetes bacterium]|nr:hypothetical protein [Bacteroidota bacterium]MDA0875421.1 hypothetical protein [Bacteroidota bacterium]
MQTPDDKTTQIVAAFDEGLSATDIAEAFGMSVEAIHARLERAGIASRQVERETKEEKEARLRSEVLSMVRRGFRTKTISTMTGMSLPKVRELVDKSYIISRDHGGNEVLIPRHEKNKIERPRNKWWQFRGRG